MSQKEGLLGGGASMPHGYCTSSSSSPDAVLFAIFNADKRPQTLRSFRSCNGKAISKIASGIGRPSLGFVNGGCGVVLGGR